MDPQTTLNRYVNAFEERDQEELQHAVDDYNSWVSGGGFPAKLLDGRLVYKLHVTSPNWRHAADVGVDPAENSPLGTVLTSQELTNALRPPEKKSGLKGRLRAALQAHSSESLQDSYSLGEAIIVDEPTAGDITFTINEGEEVVRIASNGDFFVRGEKVTEDIKLYEGFVEFLKGAGTYE